MEGLLNLPDEAWVETLSYKAWIDEGEVSKSKNSMTMQSLTLYQICNSQFEFYHNFKQKPDPAMISHVY